MAPARPAARDAAEGTESARLSKRRLRMLMRLHIIRGHSLTAELDALAAEIGAARGSGELEAAASSSARARVNLKVCSDLPYDILCKILLLVPAVKRFQFQLVSRQWRQMLTSADFSHAVVAHHRQHARRDRPVFGCLLAGGHSLVPAAAAAAGESTSGGSGGEQATPATVDIDLEFVPSEFWSSKPASYAVVAVGGGLVCISDGNGKLHRAKQVCVLNPLTRTCKVVPKVPFPRMLWSGTTQVNHLHAGALTVLVATSNIARPWVLATFDLEAAGGDGGGQWTVVRLASPGSNAFKSTPADGRHLVMCRGEMFCYHEVKRHGFLEGRAYVHAVKGPAPAPTGAALEETAHVPMLAAYFALPFRDHSVFLVERLGCIFFMGMVYARPAPVAGTDPELWGIWMLLPGREAWHQMAELGRQEVNRLTGFRYADCASLCTHAACAVGDLLCFELHVCLSEGEGGPETTRGIMVGFNMETGDWELVYDESLVSVEAFTFELMPNSFLF